MIIVILLYRPPKSMSRSKLDPFLHEDKEENSASSSISATTTTGIDDTLSHVKLLQKEVTKHLDVSRLATANEICCHCVFIVVHRLITPPWELMLLIRLVNVVVG